MFNNEMYTVAGQLALNSQTCNPVLLKKFGY